jgi:hypothetical protein
LGLKSEKRSDEGVGWAAGFAFRPAVWLRITLWVNGKVLPFCRFVVL